MGIYLRGEGYLDISSNWPVESACELADPQNLLSSSSEPRFVQQASQIVDKGVV